MTHMSLILLAKLARVPAFRELPENEELDYNIYGDQLNGRRHAEFFLALCQTYLSKTTTAQPVRLTVLISDLAMRQQQISIYVM